LDWGKLQFFLGEVLSNFARSKGMQITAIATVAVTIFMLGSFLYARETLSKLSSGMLSRIEISVFLNDRVEDKQGRAMSEVIGADPRVSAVTYVPRTEGLRQLQDRLRGQIDTSLLTSNPLPNAIRVRVKNPDAVPGVAQSIGKMRDVANVEYDQATVAKVLRLTETIAKLGLIMIVVLIFAAAVIISNTIRLTVFARRREIAIMQLVGATNSYVRAPFLAEGFVAGTVGALVAIAILALVQAELLPKMMATLSFIPFSTARVDEVRLTFELLGAGAVVGVLGAWVSVSRYLRV
jgi:cell division transport system permease protein